jgi:hypothetical protein
MLARREPDDDEPGMRIAESRHGLAEVILPFLFDLPQEFRESGAATAAGIVNAVHGVKVSHGNGSRGRAVARKSAP